MLKSVLRRINYPLWGLAGSACITLGLLAAAVAYRGPAGQSYSALNHAISELGQVGVSRLAWAFNWGLIVGGVLLAVFMLGLGAFLENRVAYVASAVGVFSTLACSAVGVFPMNHLQGHIAAAMSFFGSGMLVVLLFSLAIAVDRKRKTTKWFALPGALALLSLTQFLFLPRGDMPQGTDLFNDPSAWTRPAVYAPAVAEWMVFVVLVGWVVLASLYRLGKRRRHGAARRHAGRGGDISTHR